MTPGQTGTGDDSDPCDRLPVMERGEVSSSSGFPAYLPNISPYLEAGTMNMVKSPFSTPCSPDSFSATRGHSDMQDVLTIRTVSEMSA